MREVGLNLVNAFAEAFGVPSLVASFTVRVAKLKFYTILGNPRKF